MTTWFTSDMHFGHANIIDYCARPFRDAGGNPDVPKQTEMLVRNWNGLVLPDDEVWILGDAVMGQRDQTLQIMSRLNGYKILIPGNHDYCWRGLWANNAAKRERWDAAYGAAFDEILHDEVIFRSTGVEFRLHHFPYQGDSHEMDRYDDQRPEDDGTPLLHGHVHDTWRTRRSATGTPMINVGVDVHGFAPVSEDQILAIYRAAERGEW